MKTTALNTAVIRRATVAGILLAAALIGGPAHATITKVQETDQKGFGTSTDLGNGAKWSTTAGNLLVATIAVSSSTTPSTPTAPAGETWSGPKTTHSGNAWIFVFYKENAAARSGSHETFGLGSTSLTWILICTEYSGVDVTYTTGSGSDDSVSTTATGAAGTGLSITAAAATPFDSALMVVAGAEDGASNWGNPTNSFAEIGTNKSGTTISSHLATKVITLSETSSTAESFNGGAWAAVIMSFHGKQKYWKQASGSNFTTAGNWVDFFNTVQTVGPSPNDIIYFDGTSTENCTMNASTTIGQLFLQSTFSDAGKATVTSAGSTTLTVTGRATVAGGTLKGLTGAGNYAITGALTVSGGTVDANSGTITVTGAVTASSGALKATSGTLTLQSTLTVSGGTVTTAAGTVNVTGAVAVSSGSYNTTTSGTSTFSSTLDVSGTGAVAVASGTTVAVTGAVTISGGTYTGPGTNNFSNTLTVSGGSVTTAGGTFNVTLGVAVSSGSYNTTTSGTSTFSSTLAVSSTGAVSVASGTTVAVTSAVTVSGGTYTGPGTNTFSSTLGISGGTVDLNGGTLAVTGLTTVSGTGTYKIGTGAQTLTGGLTISGGTVNLGASTSGDLKLGSASTLSMTSGTLQSSTASISGPTVESVSGTYTFNVTGGTVNISGMLLKNTDTNGLQIANGATITAIDYVDFQNVPTTATATAYQLNITKNTLTLYSKGCKFNFAPATYTATSNVRLVGNGGGDTIAYFQNRGTSTNGTGAGDRYDADDDALPVYNAVTNPTGEDGVAENTSTNGALVLWPYSSETDTAGTAQGFPTAAFDWTTFALYSVYAAFNNVDGTNNAIYVRDSNGDAVSTYTIDISTYGNIVGTPKWDTVSGQHIVYVATSNGYLFKLVDSSGTLGFASSPWGTPFSSSSVSTITSPLISDQTNLYFGGTSSGSAKMFAVQIATGSGEKTLVRTIAAAGTVSTAPAWKVYSGKTYLFTGSAAVTGQAYIYRVNITDNLVDSSSTVATADVNGGVRLIGNYLVAADGNGMVHALNAGDFTSGGFKNITGFPFQDTSHSPATTGAIQSAPYLLSAGYIAFGDKDGHFYVIDLSGAKLTGYPIRLTTTNQLNTSPIYVSGVMVVGDSGGNVYYVDRRTASGGTPALLYTLTLSGSISSVGYNATAGAYMVGTSGGKFYFIPTISDPTPTFN